MNINYAWCSYDKFYRCMFKSVGSDSHFFSLVSLVAPVLVDTADLVTLAVTSDLVPLLDFGGGLGEEMQTEYNVTQ